MIYGFGITALLLMACGYKVVRSTDLVRMVLFLAGALFMTAVAYIQLGADLLGGLQVLLYTGGIVTLMLFAVLLTWQKGGSLSRSEAGSVPCCSLVQWFALFLRMYDQNR